MWNPFNPQPVAAKIRDQLAAYTQTNRTTSFFPEWNGSTPCSPAHTSRAATEWRLCSVWIYGDTLKLLERLNTAETRFYPGDLQDLNHLKADVASQPMAGIFTEFPSNPLLNCIDLESLGLSR